MHQESPETPPARPPSRDAVCAQQFPRVRAYLKSRGLRREELEDAIQEVFLRLLTAMSAGRIDREDVSGWLITVAHHVSVDLVRERSRAMRQLSPLHDVAVTDPPPGTDEELRIVRQAIAQLPAPYGTAFRMKHDDQAGTARIADSFGISHGAVYVRLHRARLLLFDRLERALSR